MKKKKILLFCDYCFSFSIWFVHKSILSRICMQSRPHTSVIIGALFIKPQA
jgi:hypothetical protein